MGQLYQHTETVQFIFFALHYSKLKSEAKSWTLFKKQNAMQFILRGDWCWEGEVDAEGEHLILREQPMLRGSTWNWGSNWYWGGALDIEVATDAEGEHLVLR